MQRESRQFFKNIWEKITKAEMGNENKSRFCLVSESPLRGVGECCSLPCLKRTFAPTTRSARRLHEVYCRRVSLGLTKVYARASVQTLSFIFIIFSSSPRGIAPRGRWRKDGPKRHGSIPRRRRQQTSFVHAAESDRGGDVTVVRQRGQRSPFSPLVLIHSNAAFT